MKFEDGNFTDDKLNTKTSRVKVCMYIVICRIFSDLLYNITSLLVLYTALLGKNKTDNRLLIQCQP